MSFWTGLVIGAGAGALAGMVLTAWLDLGGFAVRDARRRLQEALAENGRLRRELERGVRTISCCLGRFSDN